MIGTKFRRSIGTCIHREDIPVGKRIVETSEKRCQSGLFKIRICSFPKSYGTCLKIIVTKLIGIEIGHSSIKAAISFFLQFGQCQYIKIMLVPFLFVSQHQIAKQ